MATSGRADGAERFNRLWLSATLCVLGIAVVNCGLQLGSQSLFVDEAATWQVASGPWSGLVGRVKASEVAPVSYYAGLHAVIRALGSDSPLVMRSPSAIAAVLMAVAVVWLGTLVAGSLAGVLAGLLVAISPATVMYGQQARAYAPAMLAVTVAAAAAVQCRRSKDRRWLVLSALAAVAALSLHYTAWLAVLAVLAYLVTCRRELGSRVVVAYAWVCLIAVIVNAPVLRYQLSHGTTNHIGYGLSWRNLLNVAGVAFTGRFTQTWPATLGAALTAAAVVVASWYAVRRRELSSPLLLVLVAGVLPILALVVAAATGHQGLGPRYDVTAVPFLAVAIAVACIRRPILAVLPIALAVTGAGLSHRPGFSYYGDYRGAVATTAAHWQPGEAIANQTGYPYSNGVITYYVERLLPPGAPVVPPTESAVARHLASGQQIWAITYNLPSRYFDPYIQRIHAQVVTTWASGYIRVSLLRASA